jgi:hypothetical protein
MLRPRKLLDTYTKKKINLHLTRILRVRGIKCSVFKQIEEERSVIFGASQTPSQLKLRYDRDIYLVLDLQREELMNENTQEEIFLPHGYVEMGEIIQYKSNRYKYQFLVSKIVIHGDELGITATLTPYKKERI